MIKGRFSSSLDPIVASFITLDPSVAVLLGAPLSTGASMDNALRESFLALKTAQAHLKLLCAHDALTILPILSQSIKAHSCFESRTMF